MSLSESGDKLDFEFDAVAASGVRRRSRHTIALFDPWVQGRSLPAAARHLLQQASFRPVSRPLAWRQLTPLSCQSDPAKPDPTQQPDSAPSELRQTTGMLAACLTGPGRRSSALV